jgi:uncharacterized protein (TIGR02246 family)
MRIIQTFIAMAAFAAGTALASPPPAPELAEAQLRSINHRFVDAFVRPNFEFMAALVDVNFVRTTSTGEWEGRDPFVETFRQPAGLAGASYDDVRVRVYGSVALVHAVFEGLSADGRTLKVRYTDVYRWDGDAWRLVSGQNTVLRDGVPVVLQTGTKAAHKPWSGKDPTGEDLAVLRALNESYVDAFRRADVSWYDAHLAPDYVVVSSDGALKDRAAALADFAEPVFAESMRSFPVDKVNIRLFGDVAVIHAENAFELKDGRSGVSRYTDIWHKQDGRWQCIAAHLTPRRT